MGMESQECGCWPIPNHTRSLQTAHRLDTEH